MCKNLWRMADSGKKQIQGRLEILEKIYALHDDIAEKMDVACRAGCDLCCTRNVAISSLEACLLVEYLEKTGRNPLFKRLEAAKALERFHPRTTTNALVRLYKTGRTPPEEKIDPAWYPCPLLSDSRCLVYEARPFGCRGMVSKTTCRKNGCADMDDYVLSINTVFMQFIEHADGAGSTGNFLDMLLFMSAADRRRVYKNSGRTGTCEQFVANRPIEMIMLPPEYQARALPILNRLRSFFR